MATKTKKTPKPVLLENISIKLRNDNGEDDWMIGDKDGRELGIDPNYLTGDKGWYFLCGPELEGLVKIPKRAKNVQVEAWSHPTKDGCSYPVIEDEKRYENIRVGGIVMKESTTGPVYFEEDLRVKAKDGRPFSVYKAFYRWVIKQQKKNQGKPIHLRVTYE